MSILSGRVKHEKPCVCPGTDLTLLIRYIGTIKTEHYFHIVLEYVENGSLADIMVSCMIFGNTTSLARFA